ncbi:kinase-like domain-containing protein [Aspergillus minisclerotigenes]|uniref:Kinase-like domain-containing protein n=1 Tax=Aspergillus minisclerotigenes TaxID=656917 RepID=A0A5N6JK84_9EURO|nr:kinase-like domain-containing protein [Aspergillus minisclerotigenes]
MASSLRIGQCLRGQNGIYAIGKQLQETVWLANKTGSNQPVIVKSVPHFRVQNERDVLNLFQSRSPFIRPLIDEIVEPSDPPAIVLKYLDDNLLSASLSKWLTGQEIKYIARRTLEALKVLHGNNFVHTGKEWLYLDQVRSLIQFEDINPDNILVHYGQGDVRFTDVQLADCGNTVLADSLITLLHRDNFFLFKPDVPADHDEYELKILQRQCQFFGLFFLTYREICPQETLNILAYIMNNKKFILKIMKLDPRDRPSAAELLQDEWFFGKGT